MDADRYKPKAHYPNLNNVFFAGDFCENDVKMATVEGAIVSGLQAAEALRRIVGKGHEIAMIPQASLEPRRIAGFEIGALVYRLRRQSLVDHQRGAARSGGSPNPRGPADADGDPVAVAA